jgi:adenylate cyclase
MIHREILHYKIEQKLGEGGMGVVYLAQDTRLNRPVAIKFLPHTIAGDQENRLRFQIEARAAAALNHPNITQIYAIEETDDSHGEREMFIVMEYVDGQELKQIIKSEIPNPKSAIDYATQIARGLQAAHQKGIVHRDIKSSNIMITTDGLVKIMDFGLAKMDAGMQVTREGTTMGTAAYISPEQLTGEEVDQRTDIWSCGVVFYEMVTGRLPFRGDYEQAIYYSILNEQPIPIKNINPDIPDDLIRIIEKMLAKDTGKRWQNMHEVTIALESLEKKPDQSFHREEKDDLISIAVLPFADMSPGRDQGYFCEGMAEEVLNSLSKIDGFHVVSRISSFQFREKNQDLREIGKHLNVKAVLEGSVRKAGELLRITVGLTSVADGFYLWSERYDRKLEDVFTIQEDIAGNVAIALRGVLTRKEKEALRRPETGIEAYEFFLKGRHYLQQIALPEAQEMFEKAMDLDKSYAPAFAGLAEVHAWLYQWQGGNPENLKAADHYSQKALELAPNLAESHTSRGFFFSLAYRYQEAEKEFEDAIRLNSNSFEAHYYYARSCFSRGQIERSVELFKKAGEVHREDFQSMILLSQSLSMLGRSEEAHKASREGLRRVEYRLSLDPNDRRALTLGSLAFLAEDDEVKGLQLIRKALNLYPEDAGVQFNGACFMARTGRKEEALNLLKDYFGKGFGNRDWVMNDPDFESLRDDPRFKALLENLPV